MVKLATLQSVCGERPSGMCSCPAALARTGRTTARPPHRRAPLASVTHLPGMYLVGGPVMTFDSQSSAEPWWRRAVIYQIYPRSFRDSNGDGIGDLAGIVEQSDYLSEMLGVDAVWLSPFYPPPMADFGYDVANYTDVDPIFGDLATFDELVAQAHRRGIHVIID